MTTPGTINCLDSLELSAYFLELESLGPGNIVARWDHPALGPGWLLFTSPVRVLEAEQPEDAVRTLELAETASTEGAFVFGYLGFEAGAAFDDKLPRREPGSLPAAWFSVFGDPPKFFRELAPCCETAPKVDWEVPLTRGAYEDAFLAIKQHIAHGDCYQINLCHKIRGRSDLSLARLFANACGTQPPPFACYIGTRDWEIASLSPELFFEGAGGRVTTRLMKGTASRPKAAADVAAACDALRRDPKNRAENLMIVDMLRNDLGKLARPGSVRTTSLFEVEVHRTILQMTSTIEAEIDSSTSRIMHALFPPASVTGAPKVAACRIIRDLEPVQRGPYCGAIGLMAGDRRRFSVAIRTAVRQTHSGEIEYGIGGGIVWDSSIDAEWDESVLKANVLRESAPQWEMIECFHRNAIDDPEWLGLHMRRMALSAARIGVPFCERGFREAIAAYATGVDSMPPKVRIALRRDGSFHVTFSESDAKGETLTAILADSPVCRHDVNLSMKTNSRGVYDRYIHRHPEFDEVLLFNELGEVTEFCRGAVIFRFGDRLVSPPPSCGCLASIGAERLVHRGDLAYQLVFASDVADADEVFFLNAVRGLVPVKLSPPVR